VIELLLELGRIDEAGATGRIALRMDREDDRERIEELLAMVESTPEGWDTAIADFAAHPSKEAWDAIIRFAPLERIYDWAEKAVRQLLRGECDADAIILYASQTGVTPGMIGLVDEGLVSVDALVERASQPGAARAMWLGMAAQAAFLRENRFRTIALLRDAIASETELSLATMSIRWIRERADGEMEERMKKAGVWEVEG
jgi:hypothetical protein